MQSTKYLTKTGYVHLTCLGNPIFKDAQGLLCVFVVSINKIIEIQSEMLFTYNIYYEMYQRASGKVEHEFLSTKSILCNFTSKNFSLDNAFWWLL